MRLDHFISKNDLSSSRTEAKRLIEDGAVNVNGVTVTKPSFDVCERDEVLVDASFKKYVSRGGFKLEGALRSFDVEVSGAMALDIGASSGGFTDCLLKNGASHVICVDSGTMQLVASLRRDLRVTVMENYNARYLSLSDIEYSPDLVVMDVSFISATLIIPAVSSVICDNGDFICLIKPQFEVGRAGIGKGGIVKNDKLRRGAVEKVVACAEALGFITLQVVQSPILGGDGNVEYLAHFKKTVSESL